MNRDSDDHARLFIVADEGPALSTERDATDLIGEAFDADADLVVVPVVRLADEFFDLSTRQAGGFVQNFVTYRTRIPIVAAWSPRSSGDAFEAWVAESNSGRHLTFIDSIDALRECLDAERSGGTAAY